MTKKTFCAVLILASGAFASAGLADVPACDRTLGGEANGLFPDWGAWDPGTCLWAFEPNGTDFLAQGTYLGGNSVFTAYFQLRQTGSGYAVVQSYDQAPAEGNILDLRRGNGAILGQFVAWGPNDPHCCPSLTETFQFTRR